MLEKVKFNKKPMKKAEYKEQWDELLAKLVVLQQQAHNEGVGLVVLFEGWNGAGKGSRISDLMYHLDARSTGVYVGLDLDPDTEREFVGRECGVTGFYPIMQPFWKALGERNSITFYDRGWYTAVIQHMLYNAPAKLLLPKKEERHYLDSVHDFEQQLVSDGYVVVKFFVHMTKKAQVERLQRLHDDPVTRWRVTEKKLEAITVTRLPTSCTTVCSSAATTILPRGCCSTARTSVARTSPSPARWWTPWSARSPARRPTTC